ncbi:hypothetical protein ACHAXM_002815 [Skeletonema potamos]
MSCRTTVSNVRLAAAIHPAYKRASIPNWICVCSYSGTKKKGWKKGSRERQYVSQFWNDDIPILDAARAVIVGLAEDAWLGGTTYVGSCPSREGHRGGVVLFFDF